MKEMNRRKFVGAAGLAAVGVAVTTTTATAGQGAKLAKAKITKLSTIGHKNNGEVFIETDQQNGWLLLGDKPQDLRIWSALCAVWAAMAAGAKDVSAMIEYEGYKNDGVNSVFQGVTRVWAEKK
jgi:hypothetical protein